MPDRYLLRVTVSRGYGASITKDFPFWVRNYSPPPEDADNLPPIKVPAPPAPFTRGPSLRRSPGNQPCLPSQRGLPLLVNLMG